jgi:hypothetical protein
MDCQQIVLSVNGWLLWLLLRLFKRVSEFHTPSPELELPSGM